MNSLQLRYALINSMNLFIAVCAKDQLDSINSKTFAIISNNQSSNEAGMHWLAFYKETESSVLEFFDSFGMPLSFYGKEFQDFALRNEKKVRQSSSQFQSNSSNLCGGYCLYFLINRNRGLSYDKILKKFNSENTLVNDKIVSNFVKTNLYFPKCSKCGIECSGKCANSLSAVCIQKNRHCVRVFQTIRS